MVMAGKEQIQEMFYLQDWINGVFMSTWKKENVSMDNLVDDIKDGCLLIKLTNALLSLRLPVLFKNPSTVEQRRDNIEICLEAMIDNGKNLSGFLSKDLAEGDDELILAFGRALKREFSFRFWHPSGGYPRIRHSENSHNYIGSSTKLSSIHPGMQNESLSDSCIGSSLHMTRYRLEETERISPPKISQPRFAISEESIRSSPSHFQRKNEKYHPTVYNKEDIEVLDWVSSVLGFRINDYSRFSDGKLLCELLGKILPGCIPSQVIRRSSPLERLVNVLNVAQYDLGVKTGINTNDIYKYSNPAALRRFLREINRTVHQSTTTDDSWLTADLECSYSSEPSPETSKSWILHSSARTRRSHKNTKVAKHDRTKSWPEEISIMIPEITYKAKELSPSVDELINIERYNRRVKTKRQLGNLKERLLQFRMEEMRKYPKGDQNENVDTPNAQDITECQSTVAEDAAVTQMSDVVMSPEKTSASVETSIPLDALDLETTEALVGYDIEERNECHDLLEDTNTTLPLNEDKNSEKKEISQRCKAAHAITAFARLSSRLPQGALTP